MDYRLTTPFVHRDRAAIKLWLLACLLLVAAMVLVGGYTRLSGSGLSITEWKPVHGALPPMNMEEWQEEFAAYQASPQYLKVNRGMSLDEFKTIYWPEYFHRLLGRAIGFVVLLPLLIFMARRSLSRKMIWRLLGIFALGGLQGLVGWLMVKSGLVNDPHVSHLRLALHLSIAFAIFGWLLWTFLVILSDPALVAGESKYLISLDCARDDKKYYFLWFALLCLQIVLGAFVAGLKAGLVYNSWPLMNGDFLPPEAIAPPWHENHALIQFIHRWLAVLVAVFYLFWWHRCRAYVNPKPALAVAAVLVLQFTLGVLTLVKAAPLSLALAHQMAALLLFGVAVWLLYVILSEAKPSRRI